MEFELDKNHHADLVDTPAIPALDRETRHLAAVGNDPAETNLCQCTICSRGLRIGCVQDTVPPRCRRRKKRRHSDMLTPSRRPAGHGYPPSMSQYG
jgi:hypothetical protein